VLAIECNVGDIVGIESASQCLVDRPHDRHDPRARCEAPIWDVRNDDRNDRESYWSIVNYLPHACMLIPTEESAIGRLKARCSDE